MYAIIGAGIGGLTTALAFEKLNIPYHLYEKAEDINAIGAGIWLAPNALKVYEWLGILDQVKNAGNSIDRITIATADLQTLTDSKQDEAKEEYGYSTVAIHRAELQKVLANNVASSNISWGKGLKSYTETKEGVELQFLDATTTIANYLIGADGINSVVRKQLFPKSKIRYSGQTCWRGVTNFKLPEDYNHRGIEMWGKQTRFGISKLSADKTSWFAVAKSKPFLTDNKETLKEDLLKEYKKYANVVTDLIANTNIDAILRNDIIDLKPIKKWHTNRVCLLGDAGHATTPNMGQGGAQAIEDAYFLSKIIATNTTDSPFKEFQKVRYKKVNSIVNQSWITGKVAHLGFGSKIRNMVFKNLPKSLIDKKMHFVYRLDNE
ncbi:Zeaxanthin epoxidase [Cellulophaga lytica DSM 7489]|uniref:Zeaxanthin epoxidase n=1 Tax=Cellulophaga lytica (strain ATCC 23178 / DSM 7489 / JCM 8516 / NBRC 14961 / NCIMB 1423 / VKM B-1433 / Cy l20) TaxID=867900 RepID=F0RIQ4_CELLC|nr:FAD-dependent monooxygenase [Cellulophaga lytica]ADY30398.1 Zeaxanthin epoxidase [Cellulophaga lytica DSM 7489]APU11287.1 zeaxanthin epoxidase [Cellulophaga lytica]WQG78669.1 FAD-dependent monooxygenase [Cellulophaga lytica]